MKSEIKRLRSSIYVTNSFYLFDGKGHALIIDPAESFSKAESILEGNIPTAIYLTHGHFDHTYDCELFRQKYATKVFVHELDEKYLSDHRYHSPNGIPSGYEDRIITADGTFKDGDSFTFGEDTFSVIHTPGHTEGSCCFYTENVLFSGDTLFKGSIGRTDFPLGCNDADMPNSLRKITKTVTDDTVIYPGHGFQSVMSEEKKFNPYLLLFL